VKRSRLRESGTRHAPFPKLTRFRRREHRRQTLAVSPSALRRGWRGSRIAPGTVEERFRSRRYGALEEGGLPHSEDRSNPHRALLKSDFGRDDTEHSKRAACRTRRDRSNPASGTVEERFRSRRYGALEEGGLPHSEGPKQPRVFCDAHQALASGGLSGPVERFPRVPHAYGNHLRMGAGERTSRLRNQTF